MFRRKQWQCPACVYKETGIDTVVLIHWRIPAMQVKEAAPHLGKLGRGQVIGLGSEAADPPATQRGRLCGLGLGREGGVQSSLKGAPALSQRLSLGLEGVQLHTELALSIGEWAG